MKPKMEFQVSLFVLLSMTGFSSQQSPVTLRADKRRLELPLDLAVNSPLTRIDLTNYDKEDDGNITIFTDSVSNNFFAFFDGHDYFGLYPLSKSNGDVQYELFLKKPLLNNFKEGDQLHFAVKAEVERSSFTSTTELYGIIEPARNPELNTVSTISTFPPTSPTTTVKTSTETSSNSSTAPQNSDKSDDEESNSNIGYVGLLGIVFIIPFVGCAWKRKLLQNSCCSKCFSSMTDKDSLNNSGLNRTVETTISSHTEFTELSSRKPSSVPSFWSSNPYEDNLISQTKDMGDRWEFPRYQLKFHGILGEGCFGQVWKCEAVNIDGRKGITLVAVKTLKDSASQKEKDDLLAELKLMKMLMTESHPNVVRLLGCCTGNSEKEPTLVIMEYVAKGKLQEYLRKSRAEQYYGNLHGASQKLTSRDLTSFCYQVAKGMDFLSSRKVVHRDLAARNILVSETDVCKVADFGFSRDIMANNIYERKSEGRLPIRWMAPEALYDNVYTTKTDVWSFGVLMWEIVTLGSTPYPGLSGSEVMKRVREGHRLEKPEHCDREIFNMMFYCWDKDPQERPSFSQLVEDLEKMLTQGTDYIDLNLFPSHGYYNEVSLSGERV